jgi:flagellar biosynthesis protein
MTDTPNIRITEENVRGDVPKQAAISKAVAIHYDRKVADAPTVVASGRGAVAEQILAIAFAHGIKVREDATLAEMLSLVEVDSPIPLEAFGVVAEILSFVHKANAAHSQRRQEAT